MIGKLVRHKITNQIGIVVKREQIPLGFPYLFEGREVSYFPATQEDLLSGDVYIDVHRYEQPHVCVIWSASGKEEWVSVGDIEIFEENKKTLDD